MSIMKFVRIYPVVLGYYNSVIKYMKQQVSNDFSWLTRRPVVLYGCESWSLPLRKEHRLRVFENRVLRKILAPKRDEMMVGWRKLHNEELQDLYSSPSIMKLRRMRWAGHVVRMGGKEERV
jgi:hypothetical protein